MDFVLWDIIIASDIFRRSLAHHNNLATARITFALDSDRLTYRCFVDARGIKGSIIPKVFP